VKCFLQSGSNSLIRKEVINSIGCFDPGLKSREDWDFHLRIGAKWNFILVKKVQIIYRQSSQSKSSQLDLVEKYSLIVIARAFSVAPPELLYLKKQSLAWMYKFTAQQRLKSAILILKPILGVAAPTVLQHPKLVFLKGSRRLPFKKPIFIMRIAGLKYSKPELQSLNLAANRLQKAVFLYPKNLFEGYTHGLIRKLVKSYILVLLSVFSKS